MPTEEQVKEMAYMLWEREGRPVGRDRDHYFAARRLLEQYEEASAAGDAEAQGGPSSPPRGKKRGGRRSRT